MVSKNNQAMKQAQIAERKVPHYSLRKLGIGVVSVLLGTTMYFGANNPVVNADEVTGGSDVNSNSDVTKTANTGNAMSSSAVALGSALGNSSANQVKANNATSQAAAATTSATEPTATQNFTVPQSNPMNNNAERTAAEMKTQQNNSASVSLSDGANLKTDDNKLSEDHQTSIVIFTANDIKANDKYTIRIPKKYVYKVDAGAIQGTSGNITKSEDEDYWYIVDEFSKSGTINQSISLNGTVDLEKLSNKKADSLYPGEIINFSLSIKKNNGEWKKLPFAFQIPTEMGGNLLIGPARYVKHAGDDVPSIVAEEVASIPVHNQQEVQYGLELDEYGLPGFSMGYNYTINHGGTLKFTAPKYFKVDLARQLTDENGQKSDATISQIGQTITVHIPAGSKSLVDTPLYFYGVVNAPDDFLAGGNTSLKFTNGDYVQTFKNNTSKQITAADTTIVVAPKVPNKSDGYVYDIYQAPSYNYVGGNASDDDVQGMVDGKSAEYTAKFYVVNALNTPRKNVKIHVDYPAGIDFNTSYNTIVALNGNKDNHFNVTYTFTDGSQETVTSEKQSTSDKNIKSIDVVVNELDPGAMVILGPSNYTIATTLQVGDSLKTTISVDGSTKVTQDDILIAKPVRPLALDSSLIITQESTSPLRKDEAGFIPSFTIEAENKYSVVLTHPVVYVKLPQNATFKIIDKNQTDFGKYKAKSISIFKSGHDEYLKIDFSNYSLINDNFFSVPLGFTFGEFHNKFDAQSGSSPIQLFLATQNATDIVKANHLDNTKLATDLTDKEGKQYANEIAQHEGIALNTLFANTNPSDWIINTARITTSAEAAQGNQDSGLMLKGSSEDHQGSQMNYATSIINATDTALNNVESFTNLPNTNDGKSGFNVVLTGPAKVINPMTGDKIANATIKYSTRPVGISKSTEPSQDGFVDASQINDWSTVRAVLVTMPTLAPNTSARVVLPGQDPNIYDHAGKTAYLASSTWANGRSSSEKQKPFIISAGDKASSNITVTEQDKINVAIHYKNKNGKDVYVVLPDKTVIYTHNATQWDSMNKERFPQSDADLSDADKAKLPAGLDIDYEDPTIQNSHDTYENGYQNGTASFGQPVKYDFNNDTVVYEAIPHQDQKAQLMIIDKTTGQQLKNYDATGDAGTDIVFTGAADKIANYLDHYYTIDSVEHGNSTDPSVEKYGDIQFGVYDNDTNTTQKWIIYLVHKYEPVKQDESVTRDIQYVISDNGVPAPTENKETKSFVANGYKDLVTGQLCNVQNNKVIDQNGVLTWTVEGGDQDAAAFGEVGNPPVTGYHVTSITPNSFAEANYAGVQESTVTHASPDQLIVVVYAKNKLPEAEKATLHIIDQTDSNKEIGTLHTSGKDNAAITFDGADTVLSALTKNYQIVGITDDQSQPTKNGIDYETAADRWVFDANPKVDQDFYVYLKHTYDTVTKNKRVGETINYLYKSNNQPAFPAYKATDIIFTGTQRRDKVTGNLVGDIKWTPDKSSFKNVTSPLIAGYKADQLQAGAVTVNPDSQDVVINVCYSTNQQPLTYTVIDDTTGKTLEDHQDLAKGDTNSLIPNSVASKYDQIRNGWIAKGYQLDLNKANGLGYDFLPDNFGTGAQNVTVYLIHGQKTVPAKDTADITETIHYVYGNGPKKGQPAAKDYEKTYHFTATEIVDAITGDPILINGQPQLTWSSDQHADAVESPVAYDRNYTPEQIMVPGQLISHDSQPIKITVYYYVGDQNVHVHYIDVNNVPAGKNGYQPTDGNELINHEQNLKGEAGDHYSNTLWNYAGAGYQLAQDPDPAAKHGTFDDDSQTDQDYYVYLTHKLDDVTTTKQVGETINYLYKSNNQVAAPAHHAQAINFTGTQSKDEVTGKMVGDIKWTPDNGSFQDVVSPKITGYTADHTKAGATNVNPDSQDVVINVYYSADQQPLTYTVIDDTTGKTLEDHQDLAKGDTNSLIPNSVSSKYDQVRNSWLAKGYQLDTTKVNGLGYDFLPDNFGTGAQNVTIYLVHGQKTVPVKDTTAGDATQTITYVYGNGPKEGQTAAPTKATTYHFTATEVVDAVTGEPILKDGKPQLAWSPTQLTDAVTTPAAADTNYTPDQTSVPAERINHGDKLTYVVRYYVGDQNIHVHYIDVNGIKAAKNGYQPTDGNELANHLQSLRGAAGESYTNALWNYAGAGYQLAQALDPAVKHGTFDDDSQMDQNYYVYLKHGLDNVKTTKTVKETINYLYADSNRLAAPSYQAHDITFTGTQSKDKVTGEMVGDIKWTPTTSDFQDVASPNITGYTADHAKAGAKTVMPTSQNVVINVYYKADQQPLTYTVIDDTTGKTLEDHQDLAKGDTNSLIPNSVASKYDRIRNSWLNKGYQLDTTKVNGLGYDFLPDNFGTDAQNVTIYLVHGQKTVPVKDIEAGDATQAIIYVYGNGPKKGQTAAPTKTTTYHFTATEIVDAVTGEPILKDGKPQLAWSPTQLTDAVTTPAAEDTNYAPDQISVPAERINHGDKLTHVVHYYVGNQNVHVHYIDVNNIKAGKKGYQPTDGNELINHEQNLKGEAGESYTNTLWNYAGAGYKLAQALDPATKQGTFDDDSQTDQDYYVYLTHELDKVPTTKTVNETINYLYTDSDRPAAPSYQAPAITFTGSQHKDKVTGNLIGDITWESANDKFKDVASPKITGYTADQLQAGAVTVTPKSQDVVINVYYSADQQPLTYTVIDDTTGKTLEDHQGLAKGNTNSLIPNSVASKYDQIRNIWLAKGYQLDLSKANGLGYDFLPDNFGTGAQNVTVYLIHGQKTAPAKDTANITEIIHYVYGNGPKKGQPAAKDYQKTYHFTATEIVDAITGDPILKDGQPQLTWSADQHTDAVESPVAYDRNYTPEQTMVPGQLISHNSQPIEINIPYYVGNQNVHIHYIDVNGVKVGTGSYQSTDGVELTNHEQNLKGEAGDHYSNTLWNYVGSNYKLAQALDPATEQGTFDDDSQTDQDYYVYLTHELDNVTTTKQVGETINYLYKSNNQVAAPVYHAKDITFMGTQSKDEVTGKMVGDIKWTPTTSDFQDVASPKITGYTADQLQAGAASVNPGSQDVVINVYYKADQQPLTYTVVDDMTGKTLEDHQDLAKGDTNSLIPGSITTEYEQIRNNWINKGYQLDTAKASGLGYDILPNTFGTAPQNVTIYLIHGQKTAPAKDTADITETIHYVYGNGPKKGQLAAKDYEKTYHFTATEIVDAITGDPILKDGQPQLTWSPDQHTDVVESPTAYDRDYVPEQTMVPGQLISHNSQPIEIIIPYFVGGQNVHVHYIDVNGIKAGKNGYQPTDGNELTNHLQSLKGEAGESYTNTLWNYAGSSYKLAQALDPAAEQGTFDDDSQTDQDYYVYLKHELDNVTTTKTVEETINYLYADSDRPAAPSQVHDITFTGTQHHDKVTDKRVGNIKWTPANGSFQDVASPKIAGYTADHTKAGAATVTPASRDIVINVYYKADQQPLTYTVIDDTTGKTLEDHQDLAKGNTNSLIPNNVASKYDQIRNGWLAKGYQLDTTKANGLGYDFLPDNFSIGAQNVTVYLVHGQKTVPVKDTTAGDATQIITYVYGNGPKKGQTAAPTKTTTYHFTATEIVDAVTGEPILKDGQPQLTWSPVQLTDTVTTPTAEDTNYTPDQTSIPAERINHGDKLTHVIHYYIDSQNVHIHYIDVNGVKVGKDGYQSADGNELTSHLQSLKGEAGDKYTNVLWDYGDFGYKLVQKDSGATAGSFDGDSKTDQNYYVYLTHDLDTIKTTKQVGEIINYLYKSNHQPAVPAYHAKNIIFTGTQSKDKVIGEMVGDIKWTPANSSFRDVASPKITGYTADHTKAGAQTVTPASQDVIIDVYYNADQQPLTYTVVDGTANKTLVDHQGLAKGDTNSLIPNSVASKYDQIRNGWLAKGYQLDTTKANGLGYDFLPDNFGTGAQNVTIYLVHGQKTVPVKDTTTGDATQTITYVYGNGPKKGQTAAPTKTTTYYFTATEIVDAVTGEPILKDGQPQLTWSPTQLTDVVTTPAAEDTNYAPDQISVPSERIDHGDRLTHVVYYYVNQQPTSPTQPTNNPTSPTSPTQPTNNPTSPTSPTQPTNEPTSPTNPTQPTNKPTSPTSPTQPTNSPTSPTSPTQPTNKPTSPTSPTQPTNKPTSPSIKPAPQTNTLKTVPTAQQVNLHRGTPVSQRPARQNSTRLPQTGNQEAISAASLGLMGLALAGGLAGMKKRHE